MALLFKIMEWWGRALSKDSWLSRCVHSFVQRLAPSSQPIPANHHGLQKWTNFLDWTNVSDCFSSLPSKTLRVFHAALCLGHVFPRPSFLVGIQTYGNQAEAMMFGCFPFCKVTHKWSVIFPQWKYYYSNIWSRTWASADDWNSEKLHVSPLHLPGSGGVYV